MARTISYGSYEQARDNDEGYCTTCEDFTVFGIEPDLMKVLCPDCGRKTVYGSEQAVLMGLLDIDFCEDDFPDDSRTRDAFDF